MKGLHPIIIVHCIFTLWLVKISICNGIAVCEWLLGRSATGCDFKQNNYVNSLKTGLCQLLCKLQEFVVYKFKFPYC